MSWEQGGEDDASVSYMCNFIRSRLAAGKKKEAPAERGATQALESQGIRRPPFHPPFSPFRSHVPSGSSNADILREFNVRSYLWPVTLTHHNLRIAATR